MTGEGLFVPFADKEHEALRDSVRRLLAAASGTDPRPLLVTAGSDGFLGIAVPDEHGGGESDDIRFGVVVAEEAMRAGATAFGVRYGLHAWVAAPLLTHSAPPEEQARWLPGLATGETLAAVARPDADGQELELDDRGDRVQVTGTLRGVLGADGAQLIVARGRGAGGPAVVLLDAARVHCSPVPDELGAPGLGNADVVVDTEVAGSAVLVTGGAAQGLCAAYDFWLAVLAVAGARAALEETVRYVRDRTVFGRPVAEFENTRTSLAAVAVDLAAAHALVGECVRARANSPTFPILVPAAALAASAVHARVVDQGLQLHGGYGYMREYPIALAFADARRLRQEMVRGTIGHEAVARELGL